MILAAGVGRRLGTHGEAPKCLLEFGGRTLLDRHIENLRNGAVTDITLCVGYQRDVIAAYLREAGHDSVSLVVNEAYREGSIVSLWAAREVLRAGDDVIVMDADVLYSPAIIAALVATPVKNRFLCDRDFEPGDEPVKICLEDGRVVEFRKQLAPDLQYSDCGESVGFFSFTAWMAKELADIAETYVSGGRREEPHEEAIRDLALAHPEAFCVEDVSGLPWVEIDFPEDIMRANDIILPQIDDQ